MRKADGQTDPPSMPPSQPDHQHVQPPVRASHKPARHSNLSRWRRGFAIAPVLYVLGLIGVGGGVLFSNYLQSLKGGQQLTNDLQARNELNAAATTLSATSIIGSNGTTFCPPRGLNPGSDCASAPIKLEILGNITSPNTTRIAANSNAVGNGISGVVEYGVFTNGSGIKMLDPWGRYYMYCRFESSRANASDPALYVLSAGKDGSFSTTCADSAQQGDDKMVRVNIGDAVNRSALWQQNPSDNTQALYGAAGSQVKIKDGIIEALGLIITQTATLDNLNLSTPLPIGSGGTNATTAGGARTNLGSGTVGDSVFVANTGTGARSALGVGAVGSDLFVAGTASAARTALGVGAVGSDVFVAGTATDARTALGVGAVGSDVFVAGTATAARSAIGGGTVGQNVFVAGTASGARSAIGVGAVGSDVFVAATATDARSAIGGGAVGQDVFTAADTAAAWAALGLTGSSGTLDINITGNSTNVTGVVAIANGGTGASTATTALNNLFGADTGGAATLNLARIADGSISSTKMTTLLSGCSGGCSYNWGTVDAAGRITSAQNVITLGNKIDDGIGNQVIATGTSGGGNVFVYTGSNLVATFDNNGYLGLNISNPTERLHVNSGNIRISGAAGSSRELQFTTGTNSKRWVFATTATSESGSNAGSDFTIGRYSDAGSLLGNALTINRSTGNATFSGDVSAANFSGNFSGTFSGTVSGAVSSSLLGTSTATTSPYRSGDLTTGLFSATATSVSTAIGGVERLQVNSSGGNVTGSLTASTSLVAPLLTSTAGSNLSITTGAASNSTSAGQTLALTGGAGGSTSGKGGDITLTGGTPTDGNGGDILLYASTGVGTNRDGGSVSVYAGAATGSRGGGSMLLSAGNGGATGWGGTIILSGGQGNAGNSGGNINLTAGAATATGSGGTVNINGGSSTSGTGGNLDLRGGSGSGGAGNGGNVFVRSGFGLSGVHGYISLQTALTDRLRITATGSIGIATGTPSAGAILDMGSATGTAFSSLILPTGTTGTRPTSPVAGMLRYNSATPGLEAYYNSGWQTLFSSDTSGALNNPLNLGTSTATTSPRRTGDATTGLFSATATSVSTAIGGVEILTVAGTRVGIGNNAPTQALDVTGNLRVTGTADITGLVSTSATVTNLTNTTATVGTLNVTGNAVVAGVAAVGGTSVTAGSVLDLSGGTGTSRSSVVLPGDSTTNRPTSPVAGMLRYNSSVPGIEAYYGGSWNSLAGGAALATIALGTSTATTNPQRSGDATTGLFSATATSVSTAIGGVEILTVAGTRVGIGNNDPTQALDVTGNLRVTGTASIPGLVSTSATVTNLVNTSATITNLVGTSATVTNLVGTTATLTSLQGTSATITNIVGTSATIAGLVGTSATVTNLVGTTATLTSLQGTSATITNIVGTTATLTNLVNTSATVTNLTNTTATVGTLNVTGNAVVAGVAAVGGTSVTAGSVLDLSGGTGTSRSSLVLPRDSTTNRPSSPVLGMIRYNTTTDALEGYFGGSATGWSHFLTNTGSFTGSTVLGTSTATTSPSRSGDLTTGLFSASSTTISVGFAGSERFRFTSSGELQAVANTSLTIRGSAANSGLSIGNTAGSNPSITISGASGTLYTVGITSTAGAWSDFSVAGDAVLRSENNNLLLTARNGSGGILFGTGTADTEKMRLTNAGRLGIGTATPLSRLDVNGGLAVGSYAGTATAPTNGAIISGPVGILTNSPQSGAALDLGSATGTAYSSLILPTGTSGTRPTSPVAGMIRYNSATPGLEAYYNSAWNSLGGGSSTITLGTSTATTNPQRSGDATTGLFSATATSVSVGIGGTERLQVNSVGGTLTGNLTVAGNLNLSAITNTYQLAGTTILAQPASDTTSIAVGRRALSSQTATNLNNTAIGTQALAANSTGSRNVAIGYRPLDSNTSGTDNIAIGAAVDAGSEGTMDSNTTGSNNVAIGSSALTANTSGGGNIALGTWALRVVTTGTDNIGIGGYAGQNIESGTSNIAIGSQVLRFSSTASNYNIGIGISTLYATKASSNIAIGSWAGGAITTGSANIVIGQSAAGITTGSNNLILGHQVGTLLDSGSNNIIIGTSTGVNPTSSSRSNQLNIGNLLQGDTSTGVVAIGTSTIQAGAILDLSAGTGTARSSLILPTGTDGTRPTSPVAGMVRYNSTTPAIEAYYNSAWNTLSAGLLGTSTATTSPNRSGDLTTGLFSSGAGTMGAVVSGNNILNLTSTVAYLYFNGSAAAPRFDIKTAGVANDMPQYFGGGYSDATFSITPINTGGNTWAGGINMAGWGYGIGLQLVGLQRNSGAVTTPPVIISGQKWNGNAGNAPVTGTDIIAAISPDGSTYTARFIANGNFTTTGAIGVMTTSPTAGTALDLGSATGTAFSSLILPTGTTGTRPTSPVAGMIRYNSTTPAVEAYYSGAWNALGGGGSSTITLGTSTATTNPQRSGDATTGLYSATATSVSVAVAGTQRLAVTSSGVGVNVSSPAATLDVDGYAKLKLNSSQPVACSSTTRGSLALTSTARMCVCDTTDTWSDIVSGSACTW